MENRGGKSSAVGRFSQGKGDMSMGKTGEAAGSALAGYDVISMNAVVTAGRRGA
jgi:hypothetical protein